MAQNMVEHRASVTVNAPVHQVYSLFSHFNDFPKFMSFVKEVTYYDDQRSHWVAEVSGRHEWDAVNEDWTPDRQIGWRSTSGLSNYGRVIFQAINAQQTHIAVSVNYHPPAGILGSIGEHIGVGKHFDEVLQNDLNNFAEMVNQAPANALDPTSSHYLFHEGSAAAQGTTTERQNATMGGDIASSAYAGEVGTPARNDYAARSTTGADSGVAAQSNRALQDDTPPERPILDRDIINEPSNIVPDSGRSVAPMGNPDLPGRANPLMPANTGDQATMGNPDPAGRANPLMPENSEGSASPLPPEQMPRWEGPEGEQSQR